MHAIETADHKAINHVDHRFGHRVTDRFECRHAFLNNHGGHFHAFLDHAHLIALLTVKANHFAGIAHRHHAHTVGTGIGLHHHIRVGIDVVLTIFDANTIQQLIHPGCQTIFAHPFVEINIFTGGKIRIDAPRVDTHQRSKIGGYPIIGRKMLALATHMPPGMCRWNQRLTRG